MKILKKITAGFQNKQPFVVYKKPFSESLTGFFQKNNELILLDNFSESGFIFAPFDASQKTCFFPDNISEIITENIHFKETSSPQKSFFEVSNHKNVHQELVQKTIDEIKKGTLKKVVISRKEILQLKDFNLVEVYQKLLENYPTAFVYVWFHPKVGLWLGATPETLLKVENSTFETMSLAGTQTTNESENIVWNKKELEEQLFVTDFIQNQLKNISSDLKISPIETVKAGNLFHLKTHISGKLSNKKGALKNLIEALHPTPAVCGLPRDESKKFILENEKYDREFYTGFLGELNLDFSNATDKKSTLYVNLRCMKIDKTTANLYIGGGITKDSIPVKEWDETVAKTNTMKLVL